MAEPIDKDTRGPVNLRIKFRSESLQQFIERYGVDVSRGGIFIRTREPLPVGTRLKLDFQLVDTAPLFQGDGTVVWIREHDPSRAGVTPGMGVRFDRLSPESQATLDTILEEKIRLQQAGVAPGSIAKAGAGIAVRRPSGAFATLDAPGAKPAAPGAKPAAPPPLPVEVKLATPSAAASPAGAAPAAPMPVSSSRSGAHATTGSSSIFSRPRTTSGMRAVPVPSALFEPPTAADIDKALSVLEEKGGPAPALPFAATVIKSEASRALSEDEPTKVFDSTAEQEFSVNEAVTGPAQVLPENGVPMLEGDGVEGDLTQRRMVDPSDGQVTSDGEIAAHADGKAGSKAPPPLPGAAGKAAAPLDAPLSSLVDSGSAPAAKAPPPPPAMKPAATTIPPTDRPSKAGVPVRITTDRPAALESGRFRSDARYKRRRSKTPIYLLAALVIAGGGGVAGFQYLKRERAKRAAAALAAAAASPPIGAGQDVAPPPVPPTTVTGAGGGPAAPTEAASTGAEGAQKAEPTKAAAPQEQAAQAEQTAKTPTKTEAQAEEAAKPAKQGTGKSAEKSASAEEGSTPKKRRREKPQLAGVETPTPAGTKPEEAAGEQVQVKEKHPAGEEAAKSGETAKSGEAAKPEGEKTGEAGKSAEAAPSVSERPALKITSSPPGADVVIDGVPVGTTPFSSRDVTADGTHAISVKKDGYETHERMISGSDWSRGKGGALSLKVNVKLKRTAGEKPATDTGEKKDKTPDVEILTPSPVE